MSILGLTIDYGPYGFLDAYQPGFICNHSDHRGRYAFDNQPAVGLWNLHRLAQALSGLMDTETLERALARYEPALMQHYGTLMRAKLGLFTASAEDNDVLVGLLRLMQQEGSDYTRTFRLLADSEKQASHSPLRDEFIDRTAFDSWFATYRQRLMQEEQGDEERRRLMNATNPKYILRNYLAQMAIERAENDDISVLARLHQTLCQPFDEQPEKNDLAALPPEWGKHLEISCSS